MISCSTSRSRCEIRHDLLQSGVLLLELADPLHLVADLLAEANLTSSSLLIELVVP
jgi:hypothetical protein